jgi:hypothetical protein
MPSSPLAPLLVASDAALVGSAGLVAALGGKAKVYVEPPPGEPLPYVLYGEIQVLPDGGDTSCGAQKEVFHTVHVHARKAGALDRAANAAAISKAVIEALAVELTIEGWTVDLADEPEERLGPAPSQETHGVLVFRYLLIEQLA